MNFENSSAFGEVVGKILEIPGPTQAEQNLSSSHFRCQTHNSKSFQNKKVANFLAIKEHTIALNLQPGIRNKKYYKSSGAAKLANSDVLL